VQTTLTCASAGRQHPIGYAHKIATTIVAILFLALPWLANAQVTLTPSDPSTPLNGTIQFKATVTGSTSPNLTWWVNGQEGGNATYGEITQTGLYTAPGSMPSKNPFLVTVIYQSSTGIKLTSTNVTLTYPPPARLKLQLPTSQRTLWRQRFLRMRWRAPTTT